MEELIRQFIDICSGIGWILSQLDSDTSFTIILSILFLFAVIKVLTFWFILEKGGQPGWASLIPFYQYYAFITVCKIPPVLCGIFFATYMSTYIMPEKIAPTVSLILLVIMHSTCSMSLAKVYGRDYMFGMGLIFMPLVFYPILGLGNYEYEG